MFAERKHAVIRAAICLAAFSACAAAVAEEGEPLEARLVSAGGEMRFISAGEWAFLGSLTDCPGQDGSGQGLASHPVIDVKRNDIHAKLDGRTEVIPPKFSAGLRSARSAPRWELRKVVCGSRGYAALYAESARTIRTLAIRRFDPGWRETGVDIALVPPILVPDRGVTPNLPIAWRFEESPEGYRLVMLEVTANHDRQVHPGSRLVLGTYEFAIAARAGTPRGYADRPGPPLTRAFLDRVPLEIMPSVTVPRDVKQHAVVLGNWGGTARLRVDVPTHPVYLKLSAQRPVEWRIEVAAGTRLAALHLAGPPLQSATGIGRGVPVLVEARQGGSAEQSSAVQRLDGHTRRALTRQEIPLHRVEETILVDGKAGWEPAPSTYSAYPDMSADVPEAILARIQTCGLYSDQDTRIECFRLRADVLFGRWR